jgi:hypothetical protein
MLTEVGSKFAQRCSQGLGACTMALSTTTTGVWVAVRSFFTNQVRWMCMIADKPLIGALTMGQTFTIAGGIVIAYAIGKRIFKLKDRINTQGSPIVNAKGIPMFA